MSYTQEQLASLKSALASGALRVRHENRDVTYRSVDDLRDAIQVVENELAKQSGAIRHTRSYASFSKG